MERTPISISYISNELGICFGWSVRGRDKITNYGHPVFTPETRDNITVNGNLPEEVHRQVLGFFNGPLSADLFIPQGYPYEFFEPGKDEPTFTGELRKK